MTSGPWKWNHFEFHTFSPMIAWAVVIQNNMSPGLMVSRWPFGVVDQPWPCSTEVPMAIWILHARKFQESWTPKPVKRTTLTKWKTSRAVKNTKVIKLRNPRPVKCTKLSKSGTPKPKPSETHKGFKIWANETHKIKWGTPAQNLQNQRPQTKWNAQNVQITV